MQGQGDSSSKPTLPSLLGCRLKSCHSRHPSISLLTYPSFLSSLSLLTMRVSGVAGTAAAPPPFPLFFTSPAPPSSVLLPLLPPPPAAAAVLRPAAMADMCVGFPVGWKG